MSARAPSDELIPFLGPPPGVTYVYSLFDDGRREAGHAMLVSSVAVSDGTLRVRERMLLPGVMLPPGVSEAAIEYDLKAVGGALVKALPDGDVMALRSPLVVGTSWKAPAITYTVGQGWVRSDVTYRIAMIEELMLFDERRLTVRVVGRGALPTGEAVVIEQHATGIGLVLRRTHHSHGSFETGPSEMLLEEIRPL